jgi:hypothetical protein
MNIYFKPTWLYIKQHNITGLKYFGKTTLVDPSKYKGSGVHWTKHLLEHGNHVTTVWAKLFTDSVSLVEYANTFSANNNIVESDEWANMIAENGRAGGANPGAGLGRKHTEETKNKMRKPKTEEHRAKMSLAHKGSAWSIESKKKLSASRLGVSKTGSQVVWEGVTYKSKTACAIELGIHPDDAGKRAYWIKKNL